MAWEWELYMDMDMDMDILITILLGSATYATISSMSASLCMYIYSQVHKPLSEYKSRYRKRRIIHPSGDQKMCLPWNGFKTCNSTRIYLFKAISWSSSTKTFACLVDWVVQRGIQVYRFSDWTSLHMPTCVGEQCQALWLDRGDWLGRRVRTACCVHQ